MLRVEGLYKTFATSGGSHAAVKDVSFDVPGGGFYTLLGPSGCGKTTTLRCVAGLERPTAGRIILGDKVVADPQAGIHTPSFKRDIGMVFQSYAIWPHMNVFDNVAYPLKVQRPRPHNKEIVERVKGALQLVGLEQSMQRSATTLSGGQQQRVAFARAIVRHPKLLLLDEPLSNLDAKLREQMRFELQELVARVAITTLYVTHDQAEALALSDMIAVMSEGRIVQSGPPRAVYNKPNNEFVASFLGAANFLRGRVVARADDSNAYVEIEGGAVRTMLSVPGAILPGASILVAFRPEAATLLLSAPTPAHNGNIVACKIERLTFQGNTTECQVTVGDTRVRSTMNPLHSCCRRRRCMVDIDSERCVVFEGRPRF